MVQANIDSARLAGFFKERYGKFQSALPSGGYDILQRMFPLKTDLMLGLDVTEPVRMAHTSGWTFAGGSVTGTMFALNSPNSPYTLKATWTSVEFVLRERTAWKTLRAAQTSAQAFANAYDEIVKDMRESAEFVAEFSMLYGGSDLGVITGYSGSGTTRTYTLSVASSTAGLWYKLQNALFDVYDTAGGTKINTNADVVIVGADINSSNQVVLSVSGNATDLTNIDTATATSAVLIPKGADTNMMTGLNAIAVNTGSYAGINATTYPMWASTSLNAASASATFGKFLHALKKNSLKSGDGPRKCIISKATMMDLVDNMSALQRFSDKQGGTMRLGGDTVEFEAPGVMLSFIVHPLCKEGEAFIFKPDDLDRIGTTDFTFDPSGQGKYFEHVSGYAGLELCGTWDFALRSRSPRSITKVTGIVNTY